MKNHRFFRYLLGVLLKILAPKILKNKSVYSKLSFTRNVKIKVEKNDLYLHCFNEEISNSIFYSGIFGDYEGKTLELWFKIIEKMKPSEIYDVGANIGIFSLIASIASPSSLIRSFEPNFKTIKFLKNNVQLNNFGNIQINEFALSNKNSKQRFFNYGENSSPGLSSVNHKNIDKNLDSVLLDVIDMIDFRKKTNSKIDIIKLDIERAELSLLTHSRGIIIEDRPIIFLEILDKDDYIKFDALFYDLSYKFIKINDIRKVIFHCNNIKNEKIVGRNWICYPSEIEQTLRSII